MPIVDVQRRFRELGRIRMGVKAPVMENGQQKMKDGKPVSRPAKISTWRLTTPWRHLLEAAVDVGVAGEVKAWQPEPGRDEWELITDAKKLDVLVPPGEVLSQWWELWSGGGCDRRCDGERMIIAGGKSADRACLCGDAEPRPCKPTSRLIVMLPGLPDLGVWRLESHGFYAASELGGAVAITELATQRGVIIPAELRIEPRSIKRPGSPVKKFGVPVLGFRSKLGDTLQALGFGDPTSALALSAGTGSIAPRPALTEGGTPELSQGEPDGAREAAANKGPMDPPDPVEESTLPPATGGNAEGAKPQVIDADGKEIDVHDEPEPFVPPPAAPEPESGGEKTYTAAQIVAIRAREHGISEDARHAVIGIVTRGRTRTAKELERGVGPKDEVGRVLKVLDGIHANAMQLEAKGDAWEITDSRGKKLRLGADNSIERLGT